MSKNKEQICQFKDCSKEGYHRTLHNQFLCREHHLLKLKEKFEPQESKSSDEQGQSLHKEFGEREKSEQHNPVTITSDDTNSLTAEEIASELFQISIDINLSEEKKKEQFLKKFIPLSKHNEEIEILKNQNKHNMDSADGWFLRHNELLSRINSIQTKAEKELIVAKRNFKNYSSLTDSDITYKILYEQVILLKEKIKTCKEAKDEEERGR